MSYIFPSKFSLLDKVYILPIDTTGVVIGVTKRIHEDIQNLIRWYDDKVLVEQWYYDWELTNDKR